MNATSILPEEVWAEVVGKVRKPGDVYACAKACTTFEKLLDGRRDTVTSALAIPILLTNRYKDFYNRRGTACRLVCYDWKTTVDSHRQNLDYHLNFDNNHGRALYLLGIKQPVLKFLKADDGKFLQTFGDVWASPRCNNPFPYRRIFVNEYFHCDHCTCMKGYWDYMEDILQAFGGCIWHCSVAIGRSGFDTKLCKPASSIYKDILYRCLSRMPNLQTLTVVFAGTWNKPLTLRQSFGLISVIKTDPLPNLQLFKLRLDNVPTLLSEEILRAAQPLALKHLELKNFEGDMRKVVEKFNDLEDFRVGFNSAKGFVRDLRLTRWPLERLELDVDFAEMGRGTSTAKIGSLFEMLNQFGGTLVALQLVLKGSINYFGIGHQRDLKLVLPRLQVLKIGLWNDDLSWESLNFVMDLKELKSLQVHGGKSDRESKTGTKTKEWLAIQMDWILSNMMKSNIWEVLPRLSDLEFSGRNNVSFSLERGNDLIHPIEPWSSDKRCYKYQDSHLKTINTWPIFPVMRKE